MTMYEKLQLAEQWRNAVAKELGLIKEESPAQPLFDGYVPSTDLPSKATSSSSGRKAGRSFLDEFRSDLHAIIKRHRRNKSLIVKKRNWNCRKESCHCERLNCRKTEMLEESRWK